MPRNGSGTYALPAAGTVTSGTTISSTDYNATTADLESALNDVNPESVDINGGAIDGVTIGTNTAATEIQVDNLNANGNTISSTNSNGAINLTPNGTGSVVVSKVDIAAGEIDGTAIGANSASSGAFTTLTAGATTISGAFTSLGIDDNASAETLQIDDNNLTLGQAGAGHTMRHSAADQFRIMSGGSGGATGGNIVQYGQSHASLADDMLLRRSGTNVAHIDGGTGDVTFYEDDGSTAAMTLDASTGIVDIASLAIGGVAFTPASFTPTFVPASGAFSSPTYDQQDGIAVPLGGNLVYIAIRLRTNTIAVGTASGVLTIDGAPTAASGFAQPLTIGFRGTWSNKPEFALIDTSGNISMYQGDDSSVTVTDLDFTGSSKNQIFISGIYRI